ncbi:hypothetical protein D516_0698 [Rhodobacter sp. AKP1]|nr:hypothetical protein D516_0698 [Rhodobacter sp. AKP1]
MPPFSARHPLPGGPLPAVRPRAGGACLSPRLPRAAAPPERRLADSEEGVHGAAGRARPRPLAALVRVGGSSLDPWRGFVSKVGS